MPEAIKAAARPQSATGTKLFGRTLFNSEDPNPDFRGRNGVAIYAEMEADPDVESAMSRFTMPIQSAEVSIEPAGESEQEMEDAELCRKWLLCENSEQSSSDTWAERLEHVLMMMTYGHAAFEKVLGTDRNGNQVFVELAPILPQSVWEFHVDDRGHFDSLLQRAYFPGKGYREATIDARKIMLFTFRGRGRNFWGRPIIRSAYKPYWHKHNIEILDGIAHERTGVGFMHIALPDNPSDDQLADAERVTSEARGHERMGIVTRGDVKVNLMYPTGTAPNRIESIRHYAKQIFSVMLADWEQLGSTESGSRAVAGSKIGYSLMAYQSVVRKIQDVFDRNFIAPMIALNRGPQEKYPRLKFQDLSRMSGSELAEFLAPLMTASVGAVNWDPEIEQHIRKSGQLPAISDEDMVTMKEIHKAGLAKRLEMTINPPEPVVADPTDPGDGTKPTLADPKKPVGQERRPLAMQDMMDGPLSRAPHALMSNGKPHPESFCEFEKMAAYLDSEPKRAWRSRLLPIRTAAAAKLAKRISTMTDADLRRGVSYAPMYDKMVVEATKAMTKSYLRGRAEVAAERAKQLRGAMLKAEMDDDDDDEFDVTDPTPSQNGWVKTIAAGFVLGVYQAMQKRGAQIALGVTRQAEMAPAAEEAAIVAALGELSENVMVSELRGAVTRAFTTGREEQATAYADATTAFYSAVMDKGTEDCLQAGGTCWLKDGEEHTPGDPEYMVPNPECAGGPLCRCTNVYLYGGEQEAA